MIEDYDLIQPLHWRLWPSPATTYFLTIPGPPWSKSRPRFGTKRGYQDPQDRAAELRTRAAFARYVAEPFTGNVALTCMLWRSRQQARLRALPRVLEDRANRARVMNPAIAIHAEEYP